MIYRSFSVLRIERETIHEHIIIEVKRILLRIGRTDSINKFLSFYNEKGLFQLLGLVTRK